jgi:hypothetical protein
MSRRSTLGRGRPQTLLGLCERDYDARPGRQSKLVHRNLKRDDGSGSAESESAELRECTEPWGSWTLGVLDRIVATDVRGVQVDVFKIYKYFMSSSTILLKSRCPRRRVHMTKMPITTNHFHYGKLPSTGTQNALESRYVGLSRKIAIGGTQCYVLDLFMLFVSRACSTIEDTLDLHRLHPTTRSAYLQTGSERRTSCIRNCAWRRTT